MSEVEETESMNESPQTISPPDRVMILFMGGRHEHAITSIQRYAPDAVHIVTSDDFREQYVRRLNDWSKKYEFRKGTVQSVNDLFEATAVDSLLACVFEIVKHEHIRKDRDTNPMTSKWMIGLTGGTMHMSAVAITASNLLDSIAFYVIKPKEGQAVMPNRDIIEFPSLSGMKTAMLLKPIQIAYLEEAKGGKLSDLHRQTDVRPWVMMQMAEKGMVTIDVEEENWSLTPSGIKVFRLLLTSPSYSNLVTEELMLALEEANKSNDSSYYHG